MDDDLTLGASVWGAPDDFASSPLGRQVSAISPTSSTQDGFDDFNDFSTPAETLAASGDEADDDFGDFGETQIIDDVPAFEVEAAFGEEVRICGPSSSDWEPLRLDPRLSRQDLQEQVDEILKPLWATINVSQLTDEDLRQAEGLNQTLVTSERYL